LGLDVTGKDGLISSLSVTWLRSSVNADRGVVFGVLLSRTHAGSPGAPVTLVVQGAGMVKLGA